MRCSRGAALLQYDFAEKYRLFHVLPHPSSVKIGSEEPILTASPQGEAFRVLPHQYYKRQFIGIPAKRPPFRAAFLIYRTNVVLRVVDQLSPGFRIAAAGFSVHSVEPFSGLGRLCQGSIQTNLGMPGLDQIRV